MNKRVLVIGITMSMGGTEKALLSFLEELRENGDSVSLLLAEHSGPLMSRIPKHVSLLPPLQNGRLFTLSRQNAFSVFTSLRFRGKHTFLLRHAKDLLYLLLRKPGASERFFLALMKEAISPFSEEFPSRSYDEALAFAGDRTMFYLCDKIDSPKKIAWLHFDYRFPQRDDAVYAQYFETCDTVVSVSESCTALLRKRFPQIKDRFVTRLNRLPTNEILHLAKEPLSLPDDGENTVRLLSVMRLCHQKGADMIPEILSELRRQGYTVRWYLLGAGDRRTVQRLFRDGKRLGVDGMISDLGPVTNPYPYFLACDILILPSRYEGMSVTVEEAKLLRLPYVTTNHLSAKEQCDADAFGILCDTTPTAIATGAIRMIQSQDERLRYRRLPSPLIKDMSFAMPSADCNETVNFQNTSCIKRNDVV